MNIRYPIYEGVYRILTKHEGCATQGYHLFLEQVEKAYQRGNFQVILGSHAGTAPDRS